MMPFSREEDDIAEWCSLCSRGDRYECAQVLLRERRAKSAVVVVETASMQRFALQGLRIEGERTTLSRRREAREQRSAQCSQQGAAKVRFVVCLHCFQHHTLSRFQLILFRIKRQNSMHRSSQQLVPNVKRKCCKKKSCIHTNAPTASTERVPATFDTRPTSSNAIGCYYDVLALSPAQKLDVRDLSTPS
jgi:hypothetical protein